MRIIAVSDTHSMELPEKLCKEFNDADLIIHAGDICSLSYYTENFQGRELKAVRGNMDEPELSERLQRRCIFSLEGCAVGLFHGRGPAKKVLDFVKEEFAEEKLDIVIFGHSHYATKEMVEDTLYFNPGSPTDTIFAPYRSYGVIEITNNKVDAKIIQIN